MKVVRLQMQQQMARIQVQSQRAQLNIESPRRQLEINTKPAQMSVDFQMGSVDLDSTSLKENTGRKNIFSLQQQFAQESFEKARQGVERIAQEGNYVARQPHSGNAWGSLAKNRMLEVQTPDTGRSSVPAAGISMKGDGGHCDINWETHEIEMNWEDYERPHVTIDPEASVEIRIGQESQIECEAVEEYIPPETGQNIDVVG